MAKTVKQISKQSGRNPETRKRSRQTQNARRRLDTQISNIVKEITGIKIAGRKIQAYLKEHSDLFKNKDIAAIQKLREQGLTYNKTEKKYEVNYKDVPKIMQGWANIRNERKKLSLEKKSVANVERRNKQFEREMAQAKNKFGLSSFEKSDVDLFYIATTTFWRGNSTIETRNAKIMEAFGLNDLEQVFNLITKKELKAEDFGFDDEKLFEDWIENLNETVKLDKIRQIIKEEAGFRKGNEKTGGTTNDAAYNGPDVHVQDGSPENAKNIITRISELFVNG